MSVSVGRRVHTEYTTPEKSSTLLNVKFSSDSWQDQGKEGPRQEGGGGPGRPDGLPAAQVHEGHPGPVPGGQIRAGGDLGGASQHHKGHQEEHQEEHQGGDLRAGGDGVGDNQDQQVSQENHQDLSG